jgi:hypothetical protein
MTIVGKGVCAEKRNREKKSEEEKKKKKEKRKKRSARERRERNSDKRWSRVRAPWTTLSQCREAKHDIRQRIDANDPDMTFGLGKPLYILPRIYAVV